MYTIQQDDSRFNFGEMAGLGAVTCMKTLLPHLRGIATKHTDPREDTRRQCVLQ
jgi:hypothetical protein